MAATHDRSVAEGSKPREAHTRRSRLRRLQDRLADFEQSAAGRYSSQLSTADFMNSSFAFAALAVLSAFPFLAVSSSVLGGDIRKAIVARMGLNAQATHDVDALIATGTVRVAAFTLYISFEVWLFDKVRPFGGLGLIFLLTFVLAVVFWWWSSYMLLHRQVPLRQLFPAGVATGACITGDRPSV